MNNYSANHVVSSTGDGTLAPTLILTKTDISTAIEEARHVAGAHPITYLAIRDRGVKREGRLGENHGRDAYRDRVDESRPARGHDRSRQPAKEPHSLHREPRRLGEADAWHAGAAGPFQRGPCRRHQGWRKRGRRVRRFRQGDYCSAALPFPGDRYSAARQLPDAACPFDRRHAGKPAQ